MNKRISRVSQIILILLINSIVFISCAPANWSLKQWEQLPEREFKLDSVQVLALFSNVRRGDVALPITLDDIMKSLPLKQIVPMLEKKFNIKIDTSELEKELTTGLKGSGSYAESPIYKGRAATWFKNANNKNTVRFRFYYEAKADFSGYQSKGIGKFGCGIQICSLRSGANKMSADMCGLRLDEKLEIKETLTDLMSGMPSIVEATLQDIK